MDSRRKRTEAERCARCAEVQQEVMEAAQRANNTADFYRRLKQRATIAQAELDHLDRKVEADKARANGSGPAADQTRDESDGMLTVW